jgi:hypothetical protein
MNCKCYGNNHNNQMIGATMSGCGFFCKAGRLLRQAIGVASDLGLLPPGIAILGNAAATALGADNVDTPTQAPAAPRQLNQRINNNQIGRVPNVF